MGTKRCAGCKKRLGLSGKVNTPYRNHMAAATELIQIQVNALGARAQQVQELETKLAKLSRESESCFISMASAPTVSSCG